MSDTKFIRKEREHLDVLTQRLDYLRSEQGTIDWKADSGLFIPGEANALAWALSVIDGQAEPVEVRLTRIERRFRAFEARLGKVLAHLEMTA